MPNLTPSQRSRLPDELEPIDDAGALADVDDEADLEEGPEDANA